MLLDSVRSACSITASVIRILVFREMTRGFVSLEIRLSVEVGLVAFNIASFIDRRCSGVRLFCMSRGLIHSNDEAGSVQRAVSAISKITAEVVANTLSCRHSYRPWATWPPLLRGGGPSSGNKVVGGLIGGLTPFKQTYTHHGGFPSGWWSCKMLFCLWLKWSRVWDRLLVVLPMRHSTDKGPGMWETRIGFESSDPVSR